MERLTQTTYYEAFHAEKTPRDGSLTNLKDAFIVAHQDSGYRHFRTKFMQPQAVEMMLTFDISDNFHAGEPFTTCMYTGLDWRLFHVYTGGFMSADLVEDEALCTTGLFNCVGISSLSIDKTAKKVGVGHASVKYQGPTLQLDKFFEHVSSRYEQSIMFLTMDDNHKQNHNHGDIFVPTHDNINWLGIWRGGKGGKSLATMAANTSGCVLDVRVEDLHNPHYQLVLTWDEVSSMVSQLGSGTIVDLEKVVNTLNLIENK